MLTVRTIHSLGQVVGFDSAGGVLEILDGRVDFERFRQVIGALWTHPVASKTVVEVQNCQWVLRKRQWVLTVGTVHSLGQVGGLTRFAAHLRSVMVELSLSAPAKNSAPFEPRLLNLRLNKGRKTSGGFGKRQGGGKRQGKRQGVLTLSVRL